VGDGQACCDEHVVVDGQAAMPSNRGGAGSGFGMTSTAWLTSKQPAPIGVGGTVVANTQWLAGASGTQAVARLLECV
jgi:hypothetical protein